MSFGFQSQSYDTVDPHMDLHMDLHCGRIMEVDCRIGIDTRPDLPGQGGIIDPDIVHQGGHGAQWMLMRHGLWHQWHRLCLGSTQTARFACRITAPAEHHKAFCVQADSKGAAARRWFERAFR